MTEEELREKIIEILASCLSDNDVRPRVKEVFDSYKEAGYVRVADDQELSLALCHSLAGCGVYSNPSTLISQMNAYLREAGWRKVEL